MHFGENQLSRSLIGLSPLPTGHPPGFQPWWVRSSTRSYPRFNLPMGKADTLPRLVGTRFQVLFHDPSPGCFSPFPHGTGSLSVTREYLGLGGGPPGFTRNFTGSVLLGIPLESHLGFTYGGITLCADAFQRLLLPRRFVTLCQISSSS